MFFNKMKKITFLPLIILACALTTSCSEEQTVVKGSEFGGTNGIRVVDDTLVVTSAIGGVVTVIDRWTGEIIRTMDRTSGVFGPDDIAVGSDGELYITEFFTGRISRIKSDYKGNQDIPINAVPIAEIGRGANAITFSADGRLFASRIFLGEGVYEIDIDGQEPPRLVISEDKKLGLNGFDVGTDGFIYAPQWFAGTVMKFDPDVEGSGEVLFDGFSSPAAVKFGPDNALYLVEQDPGRIWRLDLESGERQIIADVGEGADNLDFGSMGDEKFLIYVTNAHNGSIQVITQEGVVTHLLGNKGLSMAGGITISGSDIVVADAQSLRTYNRFTGEQTHQEHAHVGIPGGLITPLTVDNWKDKLVLSSWFSNTVQIWDTISGSTHAISQFTVPLNAIGYDEGVLIAELGTGCVVLWKPDTGASDQLTCGYIVPAGLDVDKDDNIYISDLATGNIYHYARGLDGGVRVITKGLSAPEGIALTPNGDLLVYETGKSRVVRLDIESGEILGVVFDNLPASRPGIPGYPPTWLFNGITVSKHGIVYITTNGENRVMATFLKN